MIIILEAYYSYTYYASEHKLYNTDRQWYKWARIKKLTQNNVHDFRYL